MGSCAMHWCRALFALAAAAPSPAELPPVSAFPELDTSVLKDFFGGSGDAPEAPADAVESATTEAVARVGLDLSLLNEQLSAERVAVERQVESLEAKVLGLVPKVNNVTSPEVVARIEGESVDATEVKKQLSELQNAHKDAMKTISASATKAADENKKNEQKHRSIFERSAKTLENQLEKEQSSSWWLTVVLFVMCFGGLGHFYKKVQNWEKRHVL